MQCSPSEYSATDHQQVFASLQRGYSLGQSLLVKLKLPNLLKSSQLHSSRSGMASNGLDGERHALTSVPGPRMPPPIARMTAATAPDWGQESAYEQADHGSRSGAAIIDQRDPRHTSLDDVEESEDEHSRTATTRTRQHLRKKQKRSTNDDTDEVEDQSGDEVVLQARAKEENTYRRKCAMIIEILFNFGVLPEHWMPAEMIPKRDGVALPAFDWPFAVLQAFVPVSRRAARKPQLVVELLWRNFRSRDRKSGKSAYVIAKDVIAVEDMLNGANNGNLPSNAEGTSRHDAIDVDGQLPRRLSVLPPLPAVSSSSVFVESDPEQRSSDFATLTRGEHGADRPEQVQTQQTPVGGIGDDNTNIGTTRPTRAPTAGSSYVPLREQMECRATEPGREDSTADSRTLRGDATDHPITRSEVPRDAIHETFKQPMPNTTHSEDRRGSSTPQTNNGARRITRLRWPQISQYEEMDIDLGECTFVGTSNAA